MIVVILGCSHRTIEIGYLIRNKNEYTLTMVYKMIFRLRANYISPLIVN